MALQTEGSVAPAFRLQNQHGDWVSLSDFKGKQVVVYFYPQALTPGCTTQACGLRDQQASLAARDVVVLGISPDPVAKLLRFAQKHALNFTLLSDPDHQVADAYGVWGPKQFMGKHYDGIHRVTFIVDRDGKIAKVMAKVKTKTHAEDVLALLP